MLRRYGVRSVQSCSAVFILRVTAKHFGRDTPVCKIKVHMNALVEKRKVSIEVPTGITLMEAIRDYAKLDMEAACDGTCACSTCHVIFTPDTYKLLPDSPCDDEMDMLDLAPAVSPTSRLSCQVKVTPELDGIDITIPDEMENQMNY